MAWWNEESAGGTTGPLNYGLALMGSSTGAFNQYPGTMQATTGWYGGGSAYGPLSWGYAITRCSLPVLANYCVGGTFLAAQQAQFDAVKLLKPSHVKLFCGSNDLHGSATVAEIWPIISGWCSEIIAWGGTPIIYIPHIRTGQTTTIVDKCLEYRNTTINYCIQQQASGRPCLYIDSLTIIADPTSAVLSPKANTMDTAGTPGTHMTNYGAMLVGKAVGAMLDSIAPRRQFHKPLIGYDVLTTIPEKFQNPRFAGTNGSAPTNWSAGATWAGAVGTVSHQFVAAPEGHNIWRITIVSPTAGDILTISQTAITRLGADAWGTAGATIRLGAGSGQYVRSVYMSATIAAAGTRAEALAQAGNATNRMPWTPVDEIPIALDTGKFYVPASYNGAVSLVVNSYAPGTIVIDIEAPYLELAQYPWAQ